jgi:hypothetical protein
MLLAINIPLSKWNPNLTPPQKVGTSLILLPVYNTAREVRLQIGMEHPKSQITRSKGAMYFTVPPRGAEIDTALTCDHGRLID